MYARRPVAVSQDFPNSRSGLDVTAWTFEFEYLLLPEYCINESWSRPFSEDTRLSSKRELMELD